jgi:hypothetical protein
MSRNSRLVEYDRPARIQANGQQARKALPSVGRQDSRRLRNGDGVEVDGAEEQGRVMVGGVLETNPLLQRAEIVAQVRDAGRLDTREDDLP